MDSISPSKFYGLHLEKHDKNEDENYSVKHWRSDSQRRFQRMPLTLLGPSEYWIEFSKQQEAIDIIKAKSTPSNPLSLFVYQDKDSFRHFIVVHPETYWWYYSQYTPEEKCTYEVIIENEPSFIYFDLEFIKELNPHKNGAIMTGTLIEIVLAYIFKHWNVAFSEKHVINLDSTSDVKFSRHIIFNTRNIAFINNFQVGKFVKQICNDILDYIIDNKQNDTIKLFRKDHLEELIIMTDKGKKLFIDTSVYTKNRHFRIFKSTKWGKHAHLEIAPDCKYVPNQNKNKELQLFLDSLISFFPDKTKLTLLEFHSTNELNINRISETELKHTTRINDILTSHKSPYHKLDKYVSDLVKPGRVRCIKYNAELKRIVYEIIGNRFCGNIGRSHKSNNIYWIIDLTTKCRFQMCHDEDCRGFASKPEALPESVCFEFNDDFDVYLSDLQDP